MRSARKSHLESIAKSTAGKIRTVSAVNALRTVWLLAIAWYELGVFYWDVASCGWPDREFTYREEATKSVRPIAVSLHCWKADVHTWVC